MNPSLSNYYFYTLLLKLLSKAIHHGRELQSLHHLDPSVLSSQRPSHLKSSSYRPFVFKYRALFLFHIRHFLFFLKISLAVIYLPRQSCLCVSSSRWSDKSSSYKNTIESNFRSYFSIASSRKFFFQYFDSIPSIPFLGYLYSFLSDSYLSIFASLEESHLLSLRTLYSKLQSGKLRKSFINLPLPSLTEILSTPDLLISTFSAPPKYPLLYRLLVTGFNFIFSSFTRLICFFASSKSITFFYLDTNCWLSQTLLPGYLFSPKISSYVFGCQHGAGYWGDTSESSKGKHRSLEILNPVYTDFISFFAISRIRLSNFSFDSNFFSLSVEHMFS